MDDDKMERFLKAATKNALNMFSPQMRISLIINRGRIYEVDFAMWPMFDKDYEA